MNKAFPKRKPNRLKGYDYSQNGAYFITLCVQDRKPILSRITVGEDIIRAFKSLTTRECKKVMPIDKLFQRSYYDHIIRDAYDYQVKWEYIEKNPAKWCEDALYTKDGCGFECDEKANGQIGTADLRDK